MRLENRVFSHKRVRELAGKFIWFKADPQNPSTDRQAFRYAATGFVPEVVFLSPDRRVLGRLQARGVDGVVAEMKEILRRTR